MQVADWRAVQCFIMDRALPGEGVADFPAILARLEGSGFRGWYDLEAFSDDGVWGTPLEDSLLTSSRGRDVSEGTQGVRGRMAQSCMISKIDRLRLGNIKSNHCG